MNLCCEGRICKNNVKSILGFTQIPPKQAHQWAAEVAADHKLILHTRDQKPLSELSNPQSIALLVGPEGGFTDDEVELCIQQGFSGLTLGPRILRTETAALAALSLFQYLWGDF